MKKTLIVVLFLAMMISPVKISYAADTNENDTITEQIMSTEETEVIEETEEMTEDMFNEADMATSGDYVYSVTDGEACINRYTGKDETVIIPSELDGYKVTKIGDVSFVYCVSMESVIIPTTVTSIGRNAFDWCSNLQSIKIPTTVTSIGTGAFNRCYALTIYGYGNSYAETYAKENDVDFVKLRKAPTITSVSSYKTGAKITWQTVPGATRYRIQRWDSEKNKWTTIKFISAVNASTNSYVDKNVESGKTYKYVVNCVSDTNFNISSLSNAKSLRFIATPVITSAESRTNGVLLKWDESEGAVKYAVYRRASGGEWKLHGYATTTAYLDKTAKDGYIYAYTVQCVDENNKAVSGIDYINIIKIKVNY